MVQQLWKILWQFLTKWIGLWPYDQQWHLERISLPKTGNNLNILHWWIKKLGCLHIWTNNVEQTTDTRSNRDESHIPWAKSRGYCCIIPCIGHLEKVNFQRGKTEQWGPTAGGWAWETLLERRHSSISWFWWWWCDCIHLPKLLKL